MDREWLKAVVIEVRNLGAGGIVVRVSHPDMPGQPIIGTLDTGLPESDLRDKKIACIKALHIEFQDIL